MLVVRQEPGSEPEPLYTLCFACLLPQSFLVDLLRELTAVLPLDLPGLAMTSGTPSSSLVRASPVMSHTEGVRGRDTHS